MSQGSACRNREGHRQYWVVRTRKANYSTFNGGHRTPSDYSEVICPICIADPARPGGRWRTSAAFVDQLPDEKE
jgi:hypothetical protein